jgi:antitoxin MazE
MHRNDDALPPPAPASSQRAGWAEAARSLAEAGDDALVMGEFRNEGDSELIW